MYPESELLPLSGLQHMMYCPRQWALIHLEDIWAENRWTAEGRLLHEKADSNEVEVRPGIRIVRGLYIQSLRLGLSGRTDVVEFHQVVDSDALCQLNHSDEDVDASSRPAAVGLPGVKGVWHVWPVEYKRGKPKKDNTDAVQVCAQALCLEEMLDVSIPAGALYYGTNRRRTEVAFDAELRGQTEALAGEMRRLYEARITPVMPYEAKRCDKCSLYERCMPKVTGKPRRADGYLARRIRQAAEE